MKPNKTKPQEEKSPYGEYTCALCRNTYGRTVSIEEAYTLDNEEFEGTLGSIEDCDEICDDCFQLTRPKNNPTLFQIYKNSL